MNKKVLLFIFIGLTFLYFLITPIAIAIADQDDPDDLGPLGCCCNIKTGEVYSSLSDTSSTYSLYCDLVEGKITFTPLSEIEHFTDCEKYCKSLVEDTVRLIVNVIDTQGKPIHGANVQAIPIKNGQKQPYSMYSGKTNKSGQVVFTLIKTKYEIIASVSSCSARETIDLSNAVDSEKITLQIDITPCQTSCLCVEWGECHEENGEWIMNCTDTSPEGCTPLVSVLPCQPSIEQTCGNGEFEPWAEEECDESAGVSCSNGPCIHCMCVVDETCGNGICDNGEDSYTCPMDCSQCDLSTVNFDREIQVIHIPGILELDVEAPSLNNAGCDIHSPLLYRNDSDNPMFTSLGIVMPGETYIDKNIQPDTYYCYNYTVTLRDELGHQKTLSTMKCVFSGNSSCFREPLNTSRTGCIDKKFASCDEYNILTITPCPEGSWCILRDGGGVCVNNTVCENCNSLFGDFAYIDLIVPKPDGDGVISCPGLDMCFLVPATSGVDAYMHCGLIDSCYDYPDKESCEVNPCSISGNCEWIDISQDLGLGICRPSDMGLQRCEECNERDDCNSLLCENYGEGCYYSNGVCLSWWNMTCSDYTSQDDCTGGSNRDISIYWSSDQILSTSTNILNPSGDKVGLGTCVWSNDICYKDADNYKLSLGDQDNCTRHDCLTDNYPPETVLDYHYFKMKQYMI